MKKKKIEKYINYLFKVVEAICKFMLLFMACVVTAQVFVRAFGSNISWCEEIMLFMLDALMFLLIPVGIKEDLHIRVEAFAKYFSKRARVVLVHVSNIILLLVSLSMIWYGRVLMTKTYAKLTITGIPRKYLYLITVISGILSTIVLVAKMFGLLKTQSTDDFLKGTGECAKDVEEN